MKQFYPGQMASNPFIECNCMYIIIVLPLCNDFIIRSVCIVTEISDMLDIDQMPSHVIFSSFLTS